MYSILKRKITPNNILMSAFYTFNFNRNAFDSNHNFSCICIWCIGKRRKMLKKKNKLEITQYVLQWEKTNDDTSMPGSITEQ